MATFNPLKSIDNEPAEGTEYAGRPGLIQPRSLGHNIDAPDNEAKEKAFIMRFEGIRAAMVDETLPPDDAHYGPKLELDRKRAETLGEYTIDDAV